MKIHLAGGVLALLAFAGCGEPGPVRVSDEELGGTYVMEFQRVTFTVTGQPVVTPLGKEQLILNPDKTYVQILSSPIRKFTNRGTWSSSNYFLGSTEIELTNWLDDDTSQS